MDWAYSKLLVERSDVVEKGVKGSPLADIMTTRIGWANKLGSYG